MFILSFDVGIKNLAYALLESPRSNFEDESQADNNQIVIRDWGVLNLTGDNKKCSTNGCKQTAKFVKHDTAFCTRHANAFIKTTEGAQFALPTVPTNKDLLLGFSPTKLRKLAKEYGLEIASQKSASNDDLLTAIYDHIDENILETVSSKSATEVDIIEVGRNLDSLLSAKLIEWNTGDITIQSVIIENQISPIANRMKTIQGMISQFFISSPLCKHTLPSISFISSANKLKEFCSEKTTYDERKKLGIDVMRTVICDMDTSDRDKWLPFFESHTKKDDLADAYLQGRWFIKRCTKSSTR